MTFVVGNQSKKSGNASAYTPIRTLVYTRDDLDNSDMSFTVRIKDKCKCSLSQHLLRNKMGLLHIYFRVAAMPTECEG